MAENHSGFTLSCCTQGFLLSHFRCRSFSRGRPPVSGCSTQSKGRSHFSFRVRYGGCGRTPQFSAGRCARISVSAVFDGRMLCASASPHTGVFATHANTERGKYHPISIPNCSIADSIERTFIRLASNTEKERSSPFSSQAMEFSDKTAASSS